MVKETEEDRIRASNVARISTADKIRMFRSSFENQINRSSAVVTTKDSGMKDLTNVLLKNHYISKPSKTNQTR
jgi:hypothetical protein